MKQQTIEEAAFEYERSFTDCIGTEEADFKAGATWQKEQIQPVLDNYSKLIDKYKEQIADLKKQITEFKRTEYTYSVADYARLQGRVNSLINIVKELEEAQLIK
jgi:hypothetical protein